MRNEAWTFWYSVSPWKSSGKIDDAIRKEKGGGSPQESGRNGMVPWLMRYCAVVYLFVKRKTWMMQFGKGKPTRSKGLR